MLPRPVYVGLIILIALMWAANLAVGYAYPGRSDPYVNAIFGIVVAAVYAVGGKDSVVRAARRKLAAKLNSEKPSEEEDTAS